MSNPVNATAEVIVAATQPNSNALRNFGEARFHAHGEIGAVAFANEGTVWSIDETGVLQHWDATGKQLRRFFLSDLETLWCFNADASLLASGNDDLLLWDTKEGQLLQRLTQPSWVTSIAFNADSSVLASGHDDGSVRFWNPQTGRLTGEISAHGSAISAIAFAPTEDLLATAGEDRVVRVWNSITHKLLVELRSHTDRIPALAWSADSSLLISAGWDTSARVWRPRQSTDPVMLLNSHAEQVLGCCFNPDGKLLATTDSDFDIHLWSNPSAAKVRHVLRGHVDEVRCMAFNRDGTRLASAGVDRVVHIWDTVEGKLIAGPNPKAKHGIALVPGSVPQLVSAGAQNLRSWAVESGDELPQREAVSAYSVAASNDGRWLAVGGMDHFTRLHDLTKPNQPPKMLEATKPPVGSLAFSSDGAWLAQSSPADGLVWLWNTATGEPDLILIEAADGCTLETVAFHPDGLHVAAGGVDYLSTGERDGAVCLWNRETKQKAMIFDTGVYALAFDPKGRFLAGAGLDTQVHVWDLTTEQEVFSLNGHTERLHAVTFSPDGSYLLSCSDDQTIRAWDVLSGRLMLMREFDSPVQSLAFSADGRYLFTGNSDTTCSQYEFSKLLEE